MHPPPLREQVVNRFNAPKEAHMQNNTLAIARGAVLALSAAFALGALAQEVQKGVGTTGAEVPKNINVSQEALTKAGGQSANWLHTNGSYDQARYYPGSQ